MIRIELRYAIWLAYGKKDAYGRGLIEDFNDLEIDHIIPKSIDEALLKQKIEKYDLGESFTINSIENLIPTSKAYNRLKAEIIFDESHERFFLGIAKEKKKKIEEELTKVIKNLKLKEKVQFKGSYKLTDTEQFGIKPTYFYSKSLVALNGYLPSKFEGIGSCAIEFYEIGLMITLNHGALSELINKKESFTIEEQILHYYDDKNERAFVIIGTSSIHLKKEAYDQFIVIISDFLSLYEKYLDKFIEFFELKNFEALETKEHYKIGEISETDWNILISYSCKHSVDSNVSTGFSFYANSSSLIATDKNESIIKFLITPCLLFAPESSRVALLWHLPKMNERRFVESGEVLTAMKALIWVQNILNELKENQDYPEKNIITARKNYFSSFVNKLRMVLNR